MIDNVYTALSIFCMILTLCAIFGGILAFRNGFTRTANEIQERVINALESEISTLRMRIEDVEQENNRLHQTILTICEALKKRDLVVSIDGNLISISDGKSTHSMRIQGSGES